MLDDIVTKLILGDDAATNDQPDKDELEQQGSDSCLIHGRRQA